MRKIFVIIFLSLFLLSCGENSLNERKCFEYSKDFQFDKNESFISGIIYSKKYNTCFIELLSKNKTYLYNMFTKELIITSDFNSSREYYFKVLKEIGYDNYSVKISKNIPN